MVDRTIALLRKAMPSAINGLVSVEGLNVIKVSVALASIDRLGLALGRVAAAAGALGIKLVRGEKPAIFQCDGETIGFSISEGVRREKHVPTEKSSPSRRRPKSVESETGTPWQLACRSQLVVIARTRMGLSSDRPVGVRA